jgi:hypothetical protein
MIVIRTRRWQKNQPVPISPELTVRLRAQMAFGQITIGRMRFRQTALIQTTLGQMALIQTTLGQMTFRVYLNSWRRSGRHDRFGSITRTNDI